MCWMEWEHTLEEVKCEPWHKTGRLCGKDAVWWPDLQPNETVTWSLPDCFVGSLNKHLNEWFIRQHLDNMRGLIEAKLEHG